MHAPHRRLTATGLALLGLLLAFAHAQADMYHYQSPDYTFSFAYPSNWQGGEDMDGGGGLMITFEAPGEDGGILLLGQPLAPEDIAYMQQASPAALNAEVWEGFASEVPGAQMLGTRNLIVAGMQATAIDYGSTELSGSIVYFVDGSTLYTMAYASTPAGLPTVRPAFDAMVATFSLGLGGPTVPTVPPLAQPPVSPPPPGGDPFATPPTQDPFAPGGANPLAPGGDPFVGTFTGDGISLTLRGDASRYEGELHYGGQTYPVMAQASGQQLMGVFLSGGTEFTFSGMLSGTMLEFESGGTRMLLSK